MFCGVFKCQEHTSSPPAASWNVDTKQVPGLCSSALTETDSRQTKQCLLTVPLPKLGEPVSTAVLDISLLGKTMGSTGCKGCISLLWWMPLKMHVQICNGLKNEKSKNLLHLCCICLNSNRFLFLMSFVHWVVHINQRLYCLCEQDCTNKTRCFILKSNSGRGLMLKTFFCNLCRLE